MLTQSFRNPTLILFFLILSFGQTIQVFAKEPEEINAESKITAVMVYPGSAKITRTAQVSIPPGTSSIIIEGLTSTMNQSSLRVAGESLQIVKLGNVELSRKIEQEVVYEQERVLRQKIEEIKLERKEVQDALSRNQTQLEYIKNMVLGDTIKPTEQNEGYRNSYSQLPLDQWEQAWETLDTATAKVQEKIRIAEKSLLDYNKKIKKLEAELREVAVNRKQPSTLTARLQVESEQPAEVTINLNYLVNGANWAPIYDADLDTKSGKVNLKTLAKVSQRTGEDWNNIKLSLSTLRPEAGTQLPQLNSWVLDFRPEPVPYARKSNVAMESYDMAAPVQDMMQSKGAAISSLALKKAPPPRRAPMLQEQSNISIADFSAEYQVPGLVNLSSGSDSKRFSLSTQTLGSDLQLASVPRMDSRAMILSTIKYNAEIPLLAGNVSLYRNGSFVGNTHLKQVLPGEEIKLSFGEDDKVKITFQPDPDKKRKDGILFGKRKVVERYYQMTISSRHDKPYSITLYDVLPVASDENISVKKIGEMPDKTDIDDKEGVVSWTRKLETNAKIKLNYGYSVSYPEDKTINGL